MNMKTKQIIIAILIAIMAPALSYAQSSKIVHQNRRVGNFSSIDASGGWDVIIRQGNTCSVAVEANEDLIDHAVTEVRNGVLHIYNERNTRNHFNFGTRNIIRRVNITVPRLTKIDASGGCDIRFQTPFKADVFELELSGGCDLEDLRLDCRHFEGDFSGGVDVSVYFTSVQKIDLDVSGGSDVDLKNIAAKECVVDASGGCDIDLAGRTDYLSIDAAGGCDVSAFGLLATRCDATVSGAADVELYVTDSLKVSAFGASDVSYKGNPKSIEKDKDRSSSIEKED
ncbi:MAG TPA: hypothetical protein DDW85_04285 [Porphyromonadaceae bacterium]|nr:hypothetical protein [Porphyromonadaceae bacterium]